MTLVEVAKEEEAIGIAAGAYFAGARNALLMENHGFLASINGIVSLAMLYRIPLLLRSTPSSSSWRRWGRPSPPTR
jgi:sulfopyruvate decarboxylase subunit alpha